MSLSSLLKPLTSTLQRTKLSQTNKGPLGVRIANLRKSSSRHASFAVGVHDLDQDRKGLRFDESRTVSSDQVQLDFAERGSELCDGSRNIRHLAKRLGVYLSV